MSLKRDNRPGRVKYPTIRKFLLVVTRDRKVQFSLMSLLVFAIFFGSSFYVLPYGNNPSGTTLDFNSLNFNFNLPNGTSASYTDSMIVPGGSYVNISYNIPSGATGSFKISEQTYGFLSTAPPILLNSTKVTGTGSYSYHDTHSQETVTIILKAARGNNSANPDIAVTTNPYYTADFNPYIFMLSILALVVFCVSMGASVMRIEKNRDRYYEMLGWKEPSGKNHPHNINPLLFFIPAILFYIFGVMVGQSSNGGLLLLSVLSYALTAAFGFGAILAYLLMKLAKQSVFTSSDKGSP